MKLVLVIYSISFIIVFGIFTIDKLVHSEPKSKFGKWWRKHIVEIEND